MEIALEIFNYALAAILIGISGTWIILIRSMIISFKKSPHLDRFNPIQHNNPKVSVILPARNEENFIKQCLNSLLDQDYENYEIVTIDDSSEDDTGKIINEYAKKNSRIIFVNAKPKPDVFEKARRVRFQKYEKFQKLLVEKYFYPLKFCLRVRNLWQAHSINENLGCKYLCLYKI